MLNLQPHTISSQAKDSDLIARVTYALEHPSFFGWSDSVLARRYETDVREKRIADLRRMILLGLLLFSFYNISGFVTLPLLGWANLILRLVVMTPTALAVAYGLGKVDGAAREAIVTFAVLGASAIPLLLFALSHEPLAPFMTAEIRLTIIYANSTLAIRFPWACLLSLVMMVATSIVVCFKTDIALGLRGAILLNVYCGTIYSLAANYRIYSSERHDYLVSLRD